LQLEQVTVTPKSRWKTYPNDQYQCDNLHKIFILDHQMAPAFRTALLLHRAY